MEHLEPYLKINLCNPYKTPYRKVSGMAKSIGCKVRLSGFSRVGAFLAGDLEHFTQVLRAPVSSVTCGWQWQRPHCGCGNGNDLTVAVKIRFDNTKHLHRTWHILGALQRLTFSTNLLFLLRKLELQEAK